MNKRNTPSKAFVLSTFKNVGDLKSQEMLEVELNQLVESGRAKSYGVDKAPNRSTVYRILNSYCEEGVLHKTVSDEGTSFYALCDNCDTDHEHTHDHVHFQCDRCEKVECLDDESSLSLPKGYTLRSANIWVKGICSQCS